MLPGFLRSFAFSYTNGVFRANRQIVVLERYFYTLLNGSIAGVVYGLNTIGLVTQPFAIE